MQGNRQLLEAIYEDVSFYQEDPTPTNVRLIGSANQRSAVFNGLGNKLFESTSLIVGGHNFIGLIKLENEKLRLYSIDNNILFNNEYNVLKLFRFKNRNYVVFDINSSVEGEKREFGWFELSNKKNIFTDTQFDDIVDIIPRKNYLEVIRDSKLIGDCFGLYSVDGDMLVAPYLGLYRGQPETRQCYNFEYTEYVIDEKYNRLIIDSLGNSPLPIVYSHKHDQCRDNLHIMGGGYNNWVNDNKGKFIIPPVKSASITVEGDILKVNFIENGYKLFTIEGEPIFPDTIKNIIGKISNKDSTWFVSNDSLVLIDLKNKTRKNFTYFPYKLEDELSDSLWIVTTKDNQLCLFNNRNSSGIIKCYENYKIDPYRWHYKDNETIVKNGWIVAVQSSNGGETGYWITSRGDLIYQYESNQKQPIYTGVNTNGEFIVE